MERGLGPRRLEVVERTSTELVLRLLDGTEVRGHAHLPPNMRPIDFLNREAEPFIAITNALVTGGGQNEWVDFLAVNKNHLVSVREP